MKKENQSLLEFLQTAPLASFTRRPLISNKEAQTLYDIWEHSDTDEYGKYLVGNRIDPMQIAALTTKGYVRNIPARLGSTAQLEFTDKGKEVIKKIILHNEKSAFEKESGTINYEAICHLAETPKLGAKNKVASSHCKMIDNWLGRIIDGSNTEIS